MTVTSFSGLEAPAQYQDGLHPSYWRFPEGPELYTGIISSIECRTGQQGPVIVITVVNGPYFGHINLKHTTMDPKAFRYVLECLGAIEDNRVLPERLSQAVGTPIAFTHDQFCAQDGNWHPVLRFGTVIPNIIPLTPTVKFGWTRPEQLTVS